MPEEKVKKAPPVPAKRVKIQEKGVGANIRPIVYSASFGKTLHTLVASRQKLENPHSIKTNSTTRSAINFFQTLANSKSRGEVGTRKNVVGKKAPGSTIQLNRLPEQKIKLFQQTPQTLSLPPNNKQPPERNPETNRQPTLETHPPSTIKELATMVVMPKLTFNPNKTNANVKADAIYKKVKNELDSYISNNPELKAADKNIKSAQEKLNTYTGTNRKKLVDDLQTAKKIYDVLKENAKKLITTQITDNINKEEYEVANLNYDNIRLQLETNKNNNNIKILTEKLRKAEQILSKAKSAYMPTSSIMLTPPQTKTSVKSKTSTNSINIENLTKAFTNLIPKNNNSYAFLSNLETEAKNSFKNEKINILQKNNNNNNKNEVIKNIEEIFKKTNNNLDINIIKRMAELFYEKNRIKANMNVSKNKLTLVHATSARVVSAKPKNLTNYGTSEGNTKVNGTIINVTNLQKQEPQVSIEEIRTNLKNLGFSAPAPAQA